MKEQEARALWDRLAADFQRDQWRGVSLAVLAPQSRVMQDFYRINDPARTAEEYTNAITLYGIPIRFDSALPPNEIRLESAHGEIIRMVNIDTGDA